MMNSLPEATSSVVVEPRAITGDDQLAWTLRGVRHTSCPSRVSSATMKDCAPSSSSHWRITRFSKRTGELDVPSPSVGILPSDFFHWSVPEKS